MNRATFLLFASGLLPSVAHAADDKLEVKKPVAPAAPAAATAQAAPAVVMELPKEERDPLHEDSGRTYLFVGARYRGNVIPKFVLNAFVSEGKTIYSNTIAAELDIRRDSFSLIPAFSYTEYGTGDILFKEKSSPDIAGNYSLVNSSMKALYASVDLLWSKPIARHLEIEYGLGLGLGAIFGTLGNNWVHEDPNGNVTSAAGKRFAVCATTGSGVGCTKADHQNSNIEKVGGYTEPSWFDGGAKPVLFPMITPELGLRYKPVEAFVVRLNIGFGLTGFWFGLGGDLALSRKRSSP